MVKVFLGTDAFSRLRALEKAVDAALGDRKDDPLAQQILYAGDSSIDDVAARVVESCSSVSMFGPEQAVVLRRAENLRAADQEFLAKWLKSGVDPLLFLEAEKLDGRSEFAKLLKKVGSVEEFNTPESYKMLGWITDHCRSEFKIPIQNDAAQYIADALGAEPNVIHAELDKVLKLFPETKTLTLALVSQHIVMQREMDAYEIQKPFGDRDAKEFVRTLRKLVDQGIDAIPIVSSLYNHSVHLLHTQTMLAERKPIAEIAKACGNMNPYLFEKVKNLPQQATRWPAPLLVRVIQRLGEMDFELKVGRYANTAEFELAICALIVR